MQQPKPIFVVSDATGATAENSVRAALIQYREALVQVTTYGHVQDGTKLHGVFRLARRRGAFVAFTLVDPALRARAHTLTKELRVESVDLLGSLLVRMSEFLNLQPRGIPGHQAEGDDYFRRIEAMEFAVKHDDGADPHRLHRADIVLVGVSRTSKTPLTTYLAQRSWRVANVPIVLGIEPPAQLFEIDQDRIVALTIQPGVLREIRATRMRNLGLNRGANYGHIEHILEELRHAESLFRKNPRWPVIDVTHKAIEETAARVEEHILERRRRAERKKMQG